MYVLGILYNPPGAYANTKVIGVNTMYLGRCYLILAEKDGNLTQDLDPRENGLMLNLGIKNDSVRIYTIPGIENSVNSAVLDAWHYPIKFFDIHVNMYMRFILTKEIHQRKSTKNDPCSKLHEATFYQVNSFRYFILFVLA